MIRCEYKKARREVKVTFSVPAENGPVSVVGDFNNWDPAATPMRKRAGARVASVTIGAGGRHAFRYLGEGGRWFDEEEADSYEINDFGTKDCILDLTRVGAPD